MSTFSHLKQLELFVLLTCDFDLLSIGFILNGSPHLQKFHLGLYQNELVEFQIEKKEYTKHLYHQLKEIEISGFSDQWIVMELAIYLLNNAVSLERMIVDSRGRLYDGNGRWWNRDSRMGELETKRVYDVLVKERLNQVQN
ncbi:hypothetical protein L1049_018340 [Liquidambar formosana]|uniref:At1g61320/AtMIF1 LRR domain-containing protein n=1 Tax=Liquidambar formosana TaxID=63359 RepID=A0AAP0RA21_LIQFO